MKTKGVYEAHEMTKEHGYLGESKNHLEPGYIHGGQIERKTKGTSSLSNDVASAGNIPKKKDEEY